MTSPKTYRDMVMAEQRAALEIAEMFLSDLATCKRCVGLCQEHAQTLRVLSSVQAALMYRAPKEDGS